MHAYVQMYVCNKVNIYVSIDAEELSLEVPRYGIQEKYLKARNKGGQMINGK